MIVICKENQSRCAPLVLPRDINEEISDENFVVSSEWYTIDSIISGYSVTVSQEYRVYGVLCFNGEVRYLIFDDNNMPGFFPSSLFEIGQMNVLFDWEIKEYLVGPLALLFVGFPELCESYSNLVGLIDCQRKSIERILEYKEYTSTQKLFMEH